MNANPIDKTGWPNIPGVDQHIARTGETAPHAWCGAPADMVAHGGYGLVTEEGEVRGPWCWYDNAANAATRVPGGRVLPWKRCEALIKGRVPA